MRYVDGECIGVGESGETVAMSVKRMVWIGDDLRHVNGEWIEATSGRMARGHPRWSRPRPPEAEWHGATRGTIDLSHLNLSGPRPPEVQ